MFCFVMERGFYYLHCNTCFQCELEEFMPLNVDVLEIATSSRVFFFSQQQTTSTIREVSSNSLVRKSFSFKIHYFWYTRSFRFHGRSGWAICKTTPTLIMKYRFRVCVIVFVCCIVTIYCLVCILLTLTLLKYYFICGSHYQRIASKNCKHIWGFTIIKFCSSHSWMMCEKDVIHIKIGKEFYNH